MTAEQQRTRANEIFAYVEKDAAPDLIEDATYRLNGIANDFDHDDMTDVDVAEYLAYYANALREITAQLTKTMDS